jgi:hypothetical protein
VGDLEELLAEVHPHRPVNDRYQDDEARPFLPDAPAEAEDNKALILGNDPDRHPEEPQENDDPEANREGEFNHGQTWT